MQIATKSAVGCSSRLWNTSRNGKVSGVAQCSILLVCGTPRLVQVLNNGLGDCKARHRHLGLRLHGWRGPWDSRLTRQQRDSEGGKS